jgi:hypothetical protein
MHFVLRVVHQYEVRREKKSWARRKTHTHTHTAHSCLQEKSQSHNNNNNKSPHHSSDSLFNPYSSL